MTKDEAFQEYEAELARIDQQSREATEEARAKLRKQLEVLRAIAHTELKSIRILEQKTRGKK